MAINQFITNPAWTGVNNATSPGYNPAPNGMPLAGNFNPGGATSAITPEQQALIEAQLANGAVAPVPA